MNFLDHSFAPKDYFLASSFLEIHRQVNKKQTCFFVGKINHNHLVSEIKKIPLQNFQNDFLIQEDFYLQISKYSVVGNLNYSTENLEDSLDDFFNILISYHLKFDNEKQFNFFTERIQQQKFSWYDIDCSLEKIALPIFYGKKKIQKLEAEKVLGLLQPQQIFAQKIDSFESRNSQQKMIAGIIDSFNEEKIYLCEAPTGTGKSFAYLLPSFFWAKINRKKIVISTNTIALQKQLLEKDIPQLEKILNFNLKICLVKGRNNYLCKVKMAKMQRENSNLFIIEQQQEQFSQIEEWALTTKTGDKQDLPFIPDERVWQMVCSDNDLCNCKMGSECFYMIQKAKFLQADLLVVNHHILCADLVIKEEKQDFNKDALLPSYQYLIIDEGHNFEATATSYFGERSSNQALNNYLSRICQFKNSNIKSSNKKNKEENRITGGLLFTFHQELINYIQQSQRDKWQKIIQNYSKFLNDDYRKKEKNILEKIYNYLQEVDKNSFNEKKQRLKKSVGQSQQWQLKYLPAIQNYIAMIEQVLLHLEEIKNFLLNISSYKEDFDQDKVQEDFARLERYIFLIKQLKENFQKTTGEIEAEKIAWLSIKKIKAFFFAVNFCPLKVAPLLKETLFNKIKSCILTSATLTVSNDQSGFEYFKETIGLKRLNGGEEIEQDRLKVEKLDSVFDYQKNCQLYLPFQNNFSVIPSSQKIKIILRLIEYFQGRTMILLTSYQDLSFYKKSISPILQQKNIPLMVQGDADRNVLITQFKKNCGVLIGVSSFWEGIDIQGETLSCVVIPKLPFDVPTEPITEAKMEHLEQQGKSSFFNYSLPNSLIRFKQGFGRLIRSQKDSGIFAVLDERITTKSYGKYFIQAVPSMKFFSSLEEL